MERDNKECWLIKGGKIGLARIVDNEGCLAYSLV